ncbi:hypothetical protein [Thalassoglobus polymorphus]|uniref:Uncharacterized protein n=1 Tax=Thalassoglobus polymorphus TaxID=2527994 RepID=A0A517QQ97_9PLAN|nr:hypothetical protein [Thalassoglobus polymorphus]QDT33808.1 hypothetical protein Mal48_30630 [Thalassoglobus polymorphus]
MPEMTIQEAIENWVESYKEKRFKLHVAGAIVSFLGSLFVLLATYWVVRFCLWFAVSGILGEGMGLLSATLFVIALLFAVYLLVNHEEVENVDLGSDEQTQKVHTAVKESGSRLMSFFGNPETVRGIVKMLSVSILAAPAIIMSGFRQTRLARDIQKIEPDFVTPFLIQLAKSGKRIPMDQLASNLGERSIADLIIQMSLIDGVIVRTKGSNGMYLREDLKGELLKAKNQRKASG